MNQIGIATVHYVAEKKFWIKQKFYEGKESWYVMEGNTLMDSFPTEAEATKRAWQMINSIKGSIVI